MRVSFGAQIVNSNFSALKKTLFSATEKPNKDFKLYVDGIHLNEHGGRIIASMVQQFIQENK